MSGWIKMSVHLRTHPKVVRMASALRADRLRVVGGLWAVWCIFDAHTEDGLLEGYTLQAIDDDLGWKGFAAAMQSIGWLEERDDGLVAPDYDEHNGPSAKRRASETKRKAESRVESGDVRTKAELIADGKQTESGQMSASDADTKRSREEKRREEKKKDPPATRVPPAEAGEKDLKAKDLEAEGVGAEFARDWLRIRRAKKAPLTPTAWDAIKREAATAGMTPAQAVKIAAESNWQGFKASWLTTANGSHYAVAGKQKAIEDHNRAVGDEWLRQQEARDAAH